MISPSLVIQTLPNGRRIFSVDVGTMTRAQAGSFMNLLCKPMPLNIWVSPAS